MTFRLYSHRIEPSRWLLDVLISNYPLSVSVVRCVCTYIRWVHVFGCKQDKCICSSCQWWQVGSVEFWDNKVFWNWKFESGASLRKNCANSATFSPLLVSSPALTRFILQVSTRWVINLLSDTQHRSVCPIIWFSTLLACLLHCSIILCTDDCGLLVMMSLQRVCAQETSRVNSLNGSAKRFIWWAATGDGVVLENNHKRIVRGLNSVWYHPDNPFNPSLAATKSNWLHFCFDIKMLLIKSSNWLSFFYPSYYAFVTNRLQSRAFDLTPTVRTYTEVNQFIKKERWLALSLLSLFEKTKP